MAIERASPINITPVSSTQAPRVISDMLSSQGKASVPNNETKQTASNSASVTLSEAQAMLSQPGTEDINTERVETLKAAIRNGELKMDTGKIADALIHEAQNLLRGL